MGRTHPRPASLLQLVTGLALGAVYVLLALGLSLIFGMLTVVNFAHGAFFMVGAYAGRLAAFAQTGNFWICLVLVPLGVGAHRPADRAHPGAAALRTRHRLSAAADLRPVATSLSKWCASSSASTAFRSPRRRR